ncbi:unnamed protein product [Ascophyllum nodosum]
MLVLLYLSPPLDPAQHRASCEPAVGKQYSVDIKLLLFSLESFWKHFSVFPPSGESGLRYDRPTAQATWCFLQLGLVTLKHPSGHFFVKRAKSPCSPPAGAMYCPLASYLTCSAGIDTHRFHSTPVVHHLIQLRLAETVSLASRLVVSAA